MHYGNSLCECRAAFEVHVGPIWTRVEQMVLQSPFSYTRCIKNNKKQLKPPLFFLFSIQLEIGFSPGRVILGRTSAMCHENSLHNHKLGLLECCTRGHVFTAGACVFHEITAL